MHKNLHLIGHMMREQYCLINFQVGFRKPINKILVHSATRVNKTVAKLCRHFQIPKRISTRLP